MKSLVKLSNNEPQPVMAVAVSTLTPEWGLLYLQDDGDNKAGDIVPICGGNLEENTVYKRGTMPPDWRNTVETGNYSAEVITAPMFQGIQEVELGQMKNGKPICELIIINARIIPMPEPTIEETPRCRVIQHPAAMEVLATRQVHAFAKGMKRLRKKAKANTDPKQAFLFPEIDLQPHKETA